MFSRVEREFLSILADGSAEEASVHLARAFPNPVYRRKLLWAIRQKAGRSLSDWQLYAKAAAREPRLLPRPPDPAGNAVPLYEDSFVTLLSAVRRLLAPRRPPTVGGSGRER